MSVCFSGGGNALCDWFIFPLACSPPLLQPPAGLMDYTELVIYLCDCCCSPACTPFLFPQRSVKRAPGSEAVARFSFFASPPLRLTFLRPRTPRPRGTLCFYYSVFPPGWDGVPSQSDDTDRGRPVSFPLSTEEERERFVCSPSSPPLCATSCASLELAGLSVVRVVYR